jgi:hypothetical protein
MDSMRDALPIIIFLGVFLLYFIYAMFRLHYVAKWRSFFEQEEKHKYKKGGK